MLSGEFLALRKEVIGLRERAGRVRHLEADNALLHLSLARLEHENKSLRQALAIVHRRLRDEEDRKVAEATAIAELSRRSSRYQAASSPSPTRGSRMSTPAPPRTLEELRIALSSSPPTTPRPRTQSPLPYYRSPAKMGGGGDGWSGIELSALSRPASELSSVQRSQSSPSRQLLALSPVRRLYSTSPIRTTTPVALSRRIVEQQQAKGGATVRHAVRSQSPPAISGLLPLYGSSARGAPPTMMVMMMPVQKPPLGRQLATGNIHNMSSIAEADDSSLSDLGAPMTADGGNGEDNPLARAIFY